MVLFGRDLWRVPGSTPLLRQVPRTNCLRPYLDFFLLPPMMEIPLPGQPVPVLTRTKFFPVFKGNLLHFSFFPLVLDLVLKRAWLHFLVPLQVQDFALLLAEFHEILVSLFLHPVDIQHWESIWSYSCEPLLWDDVKFNWLMGEHLTICRQS